MDEDLINKLHSSTKYLQPLLINQCFFKDKVTHVDKSVCGNGFTTGFLNIKPGFNKVNIIIAPNKAVIFEKKAEYDKGAFKGLRMKFFFKESFDSDFSDADVLFFVADSFLMMSKKLNEIKHRIDKVLIDEFHSVEIQSLFRKKLIDFEDKVKNICSHSDTSIVTVTASPNLYSKIDILIENSEIEPRHINISKNRETAIHRIKEDLKNGEKVVILTNSAKTIYSLRNRKNTIEARFIIGISLTRSLVEMVKISYNQDSNLTIISSKGFEGFDVYYDDAKVYYFEDRTNEHETFYIANLYQAINRNRNRIKYIEYNRLELSNERKNEFNDIEVEVDNFVNDSSVSIASKQTKKYKKFHSFVIFNQDSNGNFSLKKNIVSIQLHQERLLFDKPFFTDDFKEFIKVRNINFSYLNENNNRLKTKIKTETKIKNLLSNITNIEELDLFGNDYKIEIIDLHNQKDGKNIADNRSLYLRHLDNYLRRKNYNGERITTNRETIALNLLQSGNEFNKLVNEVTRAYDSRSIEKYGFNKSLEYRSRFKEQSYNTVCKFILMFVNDNISLYSKWVANRNYNLLTEIGINEIKIIANVFDVTVKEIDIRNCFPRVLYAINSMELPCDFYGENKRKKLNINIFLNDFFYDSAQRTKKKVQRNNAILKFRNLGFNVNVISYLINRFFEPSFKGDLFNMLSFHEKKIISQVKDLIKNTDNAGAIRRHDSLIIFDNKSDLSFLNNFEFMNVGGWFNVPTTKVINFEEYQLKQKEQEAINKYLNFDSKLMLMSL